MTAISHRWRTSVQGALAAPVLVVLLHGSMAGQTDPARGRVVAVVDAMARTFVSDDAIPALGLAVMKGGDLLLAKGYGRANVERTVPATAETVFEIGSVTKQFTAAAILQLVDDGKVGLQDEVTEYLPDYPTHGERITVEELLNHTAGVPNYTEFSEFYPTKSSLPLSDQEMMELIASRPLDFTPGTRWHYSNSGYYLLGLIVEKASGMEYDEYLRARIFEPLGLRHTYYCHNESIIPHRAAGYEWRNGELVNASFIHMNTPGAAGGLCATPLDLVRWTKALHSGKVVSAASYRKMITPAGPARNPTAYVPWAAYLGRYGYGIGVSELGGHRWIGHPGGINGFTDYVVYFPDDDLVVVAALNTGSDSGDPITFARQVAARILGIPESAIPVVR